MGIFREMGVQARSIRPPWAREGATNLPPDITQETAIQLTAVYRAVQVIAGTISIAPLVVYEQRGEHREKVRPPAWEPIWGVPNARQARVDFWSTEVARLLLLGNSVLYVEGEPPFGVTSIWAIHPQRVARRRVYDERDGRYHYRWRVAWGQDVSDRPGQVEWLADVRDGGPILHVPNLRTGGGMGISPIDAARRALQANIQAERYATAVYGNSSGPGGVVEFPEGLKDEEIDAAIRRWDEQHKGPQRAGRVAVLSSGAKWVSGAMPTPEAMQFLAARNYGVREIARLFGVPPVLLADSTATTAWGSGLETIMRSFVDVTLAPLAARLSGALQDVLLPNGMECEFDLSRLYRGTTKDRYMAHAVGVGGGWLNPNEVRDEEGKGPRLDGRGDEYLQQSQLVPALKALMGMPDGGATAPAAEETGEE